MIHSHYLSSLQTRLSSPIYLFSTALKCVWSTAILKCLNYLISIYCVTSWVLGDFRPLNFPFLLVPIFSFWVDFLKLSIHSLSLCFLQVVEIAIKVSPVLSSHMFQPLLPSVLQGIVEGEVSLNTVNSITVFILH